MIGSDRIPGEKEIADDSPRPGDGEVSAANARLPKGFRKAGLGSKFSGGSNFHEMYGRNNNYRSGLDDRKMKTPLPAQFFKDLKTVHNIKRVITLNADHNPGTVKAARDAGMEVLYVPTGKGRTPGGVETLDMDAGEWSQVKAMLDEGDTLIHCTHGADRTGATVGRYYIENEKWDFDRAFEDAQLYKSGKFYDSMKRFISHGVEGETSVNPEDKDETVR